jgi:hypothetical protein
MDPIPRIFNIRQKSVSPLQEIPVDDGGNMVKEWPRGERNKSAPSLSVIGHSSIITNEMENLPLRGTPPMFRDLDSWGRKR